MSHRIQGPGEDESSEGTTIDLGFAGLSAGVGNHISHFYRSQEEITQVLAPYFLASLRAGDKCTLFCQPEVGEMVMTGLIAEGMDVDAALNSGQIGFHEGGDSAQKTMELFSDMVNEAMKSGYRLIRHAGDMAWGLAKMPSADELVRWEAMYDLHFATRFPLIALCQYDLRAFGGDVVVDALKTHPVNIIGETIHRNPYYMSPKEFLEELEGR